MTRDEQIYQDKKSMTTAKVAQKYSLSERRVLAICSKMSLRQQLEEERQHAKMYRQKYFSAVMSNLNKKGDSPHE